MQLDTCGAQVDLVSAIQNSNGGSTAAAKKVFLWLKYGRSTSVCSDIGSKNLAKSH